MEQHSNDLKNLCDFSEYKKRKLEKRILDDINKILLILEKSQQALSFFKKYKPIQEIISVIETNKVLFELKKKVYETNLQKDKKTNPSDDKNR